MPVQADVSVIIPVYNSAAYLTQALASVWAQTVSVLEVIVVDDGSTDDTPVQLAAAGDPRLRVVTQPHQGAGPARNRGVELAQAPYLTFLDADDLWLPHKLEQQLATLAAEPDADLVFGHYEEFAELGATAAPRPAGPGYSCGTLLARRAAFDQVGPFSGAWRVGEFIDWYARAQDLGLKSVMRPEVVLRRRLHAHNTTRGARQDYAAVVAALYRRRRADPAGAGQ